jgi:hypothetical protein
MELVWSGPNGVQPGVNLWAPGPPAWFGQLVQLVRKWVA